MATNQRLDARSMARPTRPTASRFTVPQRPARCSTTFCRHSASIATAPRACSVLAGVISLALAMVIGFQGVAWIGVGGYVLAGLLLRGGRAR